MTDATVAITKQIEALLEKEAAATKALVESTVPDAVKKQIAEQLDPLRAEIAGLKAMNDRVKRDQLPGLEYAKHGEVGKFSIWRLCQLGFELKDGNFKAREEKYFGAEVEAMNEILKRRNEEPTFTRTAMNIGSSGTGGVFVPNTVMADAIIPDLRAMSVVERAGASTIEGLVGTFDWIVDQGGTTAYEIDTEAQEAATESSDTFKLISVSPHTVSANTSLTRGMRHQSAIAMEPRVRAKFTRELALKQDQHALEGSGVGRIPLGIHTTTGIGSTSWSSADFGPSLSGTNQNIDNLLRTMAYAPGIANFESLGGRAAWVAQPQVGLKIASVQSTNERVPVFANLGAAKLTSLLGTPFLHTTNVTAATFTSSNRYLVYSDDWSQMTICRWGAMNILAGYVGNDMTSDVLTLAAFMEHDILVEQPKAFVKATSLTAA